MTKTYCLVLGLVLISAVVCAAQTGPAGPPSIPRATKPPATILRDHNGNIISDEEFVDIRMANFQSPDETITRVLEDGTRELTTARVPQEGTDASNFYAKYLDGLPFELQQLRGKVVVLNFWFIGCPACEDEVPQLDAFKLKFAKYPDVVFLAVTYNKLEAVKQYLRTHKMTYKPVADAQEAVDAFDVAGYPKNIVIGKTGRIVYWRSTVKSWTKFEAAVWGELAKEP